MSAGFFHETTGWLLQRPSTSANPSVNSTDTSACWLWQGNRFEPSAGLPLSDRGFRYGMSVFETVRIHAGQPVFWSAHLNRLRLSSSACGFLVAESVLNDAKTLISQRWEEGVLRVYVTAGDGAPTEPPAQSRIAVLWESRSRQPAQNYYITTSNTPNLALFGGLKTGNYWANAHSLSAAREKGSNEVLLFTPNNHLIGGCMANAFVRIDGAWRTPSLSCGAREGVVREWVLDHFNAHQADITRSELNHADAVFLTSSWLGVMPARQLDDRPLCVPNSVLNLKEMLEVKMNEGAGGTDGKSIQEI